jgi:hypothetical protein
MIWREKIKGVTSTPRTSTLRKPRAQMQSPSRMTWSSLGDYEHITTMDDNINWMKLTHILSIVSLTLGPLFAHLPLLQKAYTLEKNTTPLPYVR